MSGVSNDVRPRAFVLGATAEVDAIAIPSWRWEEKRDDDRKEKENSVKKGGAKEGPHTGRAEAAMEMNERGRRKNSSLRR